jgi:hypothetical protein
MRCWLLTNRHGRAFNTWPLSSAACFYLDLGLAMDLVSSDLLLIEEGLAAYEPSVAWAPRSLSTIAIQLSRDGSTTTN